jgi:hypothetical protein
MTEDGVDIKNETFTKYIRKEERPC